MPENQAATVDLANLASSAYLQDPKHPKVLYDLLNKLSGELFKRNAHSYEGFRIKGYLALVEHRPAEAEQMFRRANQVKPGQDEIIVGLMDALYQTNRSAEAEKVGLDAIAAVKTAGPVYDALARLYMGDALPHRAVASAVFGDLRDCLKSLGARSQRILIRVDAHCIRKVGV